MIRCKYVRVFGGLSTNWFPCDFFSNDGRMRLGCNFLLLIPSWLVYLPFSFEYFNFRRNSIFDSPTFFWSFYSFSGILDYMNQVIIWFLIGLILCVGSPLLSSTRGHYHIQRFPPSRICILPHTKLLIPPVCTHPLLFTNISLLSSRTAPLRLLRLPIPSLLVTRIFIPWNL